MPKVDTGVLRQIKEALSRYEREVEASGLKITSKNTYVLHARHFVRWLDDDFRPGSTLR
jgi:hypothetical protein